MTLKAIAAITTASTMTKRHPFAFVVITFSLLKRKSKITTHQAVVTADATAHGPAKRSIKPTFWSGAKAACS